MKNLASAILGSKYLKISKSISFFCTIVISSLLLSGYSEDHVIVSQPSKGIVMRQMKVSPANQQSALKTPIFTTYRVAYNLKFVNNSRTAVKITGATYEFGGVPVGGLLFVDPNSEGVFLTSAWIDSFTGNVAHSIQLEIFSEGNYHVTSSTICGPGYPSALPAPSSPGSIWYAILDIDQFYINSTITSTPSIYICPVPG